jgi:hypothetical protein
VAPFFTAGGCVPRESLGEIATLNPAPNGQFAVVGLLRPDVDHRLVIAVNDSYPQSGVADFNLSLPEPLLPVGLLAPLALAARSARAR